MQLLLDVIQPLSKRSVPAGADNVTLRGSCATEFKKNLPVARRCGPTKQPQSDGLLGRVGFPLPDRARDGNGLWLACTQNFERDGLARAP